jgi:hypothetical protein
MIIFSYRVCKCTILSIDNVHYYVGCVWAVIIDFAYKWLCQCFGGKRVVAAAPGRLVVQDQVPGMVMATASSVSVSRAERKLPYTCSEAKF